MSVKKKHPDGSEIEFSDKEWSHMNAVWKSYKTAEERKAFYHGVLEAKKNDPKYSVFDAFPIFETEAARLARVYGDLILEGLKGKKERSG